MIFILVDLKQEVKSIGQKYSQKNCFFVFIFHRVFWLLFMKVPSHLFSMPVPTDHFQLILYVKMYIEIIIIEYVCKCNIILYQTKSNNRNIMASNNKNQPTLLVVYISFLLVIVNCSQNSTQIVVQTIPICYDFNIHTLKATFKFQQLSHDIVVRANLPMIVQGLNKTICSLEYECAIQSSQLDNTYVLTFGIVELLNITRTVCISPSDLSIHPLNNHNLEVFQGQYVESADGVKIYLLNPQQNSTLQFCLLQDYPQITVFVCPKNDKQFKQCVDQLLGHVQNNNKQFSSNYYRALSLLHLAEYQQVPVQASQDHYWLVGVACQLGSCQLGIGVNTTQSAPNQGLQFRKQRMMQRLIYRDFSVQELRNGRWNVIKKQETKFFQLTNSSELILRPQQPFIQSYYTCFNWNQTFIQNTINQQQSVIKFHHPYSFQENSTSFKLCALHATDQIKVYLQDLPLLMIQPKNPLILHLRATTPKTLHYLLNSSQKPSLFVHLRKCIDSPITLRYFILPDFEAIKQDKVSKGEDQETPDFYVKKKEIRIKDIVSSFQIVKGDTKFTTNKLIIELVCDSYAVVEVELFNGKVDKKIQEKRSQKIIFTKESFKENQQQPKQIQFELQFHVRKQLLGSIITNKTDLHNSTNIKGIKNRLKIYSMEKPDQIQKKTLCPDIMFKTHPQSRGLHNDEYEIQIQEAKDQNRSKNEVIIKVYGNSSLPYIGLQLSLDHLVLYQWVQLKGRINLLAKYRFYLVAVVGVVVGTLLGGTLRLLQTKAKVSSKMRQGQE